MGSLMTEQVLQNNTNYAEQHERLQLSIHLTDVINKNSALMNEAQREFERSPGSVQDRIKFNQRAIDLMQAALSAGDWEKSLLLHNLAAQLQEKLDLLLAQREELLIEASPKKHKLAAVTDQQQVVYLSLYQVDGYSLNKWTQLLLGLERYNLSRPVHANESEAQKAIRSHGDPITEAYVAVVVDKKKIRQQENQQCDRWGQPILNLHENAVLNDNILEFVHNKQRYQVVDSSLVVNDNAHAAGGA